MLTLRDYQNDAIRGVAEAYAQGARGVFLALPTGAGKTVIFTEIARQFVARQHDVCIVAHRQELIHQAGRTVAANKMFYGVIKAGPSTTPGAPIQIVSIDSMRTRTLPRPPRLIILDEAHLAKAERYNKFLEKYPDALRLLVSATPCRLDGTGFRDIADVLIQPANIGSLIAHPDGPFLVPPALYTGSDISASLRGIKKTGGDYNRGELNRLMRGARVVGDVLRGYQRFADGRKGVVFCAGIEHSMAVTARFRQAGIAAEHIDGTMDDATRAGILARLRTGETTIVTNAAILCEGWDEPSISYVGLARPTKSLALYIQQAGRGLRIHPESHKTDCVIIDHGDNVAEHGHILEERAWSLDGKPARKPEYNPFRQCASCLGWFPRHRDTCTLCGFRPERQTQTYLDMAEQDIKPVALSDVEHPIIREYRKLLIFARNRGFKQGWAWFRIQEKFKIEDIRQHLTYGIAKRMQAEFYTGVTEREAECV